MSPELRAAILFFALAAAGCAVDSSLDETATSTEALANNGSSHHASYTCDGPFCTCTGDDDCNDMFSDGVCGERAICQISPTDIPRCRCSVARIGARGTVAVRPIGGLAATP